MHNLADLDGWVVEAHCLEGGVVPLNVSLALLLDLARLGLARLGLARIIGCRGGLPGAAPFDAARKSVHKRHSE